MTAFQLKKIPRLSLSPPHVALCSAQLSPLMLFSPLLLFSASFHPHVCLSFHASNLSSSPAPNPYPHLNHHHSPSIHLTPPPHPPVLRYPISPLGLTSNGCVSPSFSPRLLFFRPSKTWRCHCSPRQTIYSHVRETCRHPSATFDHCFYRESSLPCSAFGWQGDGKSGRMKGGKKSKVMSSLADMCSQAAAARSRKQSWHIHTALSHER